MNQAKTFITPSRQEKAFFLGTEIQWRDLLEKKIVLTKKGKPSLVTARMALLAPIEKLIYKIISRQFFKWN